MTNYPKLSAENNSAGATELEPCPFCGQEPIERAIEAHSHSPAVQALGIPDHEGSHVVECGCGAGLIASTRPEVLAMWNRRAPAAQQDEVDELKTICAEAYQVVGVLADDCGRFNDPHVTKVLDNLSEQRLVHNDVLPFPSIEPAAQQDASAAACDANAEAHYLWDDAIRCDFEGFKARVAALVDKCQGGAAQAVPELTSRVINEACWKFIDAMPHPLTPQVWNNLKPALYAAVVHVLTARPVEPVQQQPVRGADDLPGTWEQSDFQGGYADSTGDQPSEQAQMFPYSAEGMTPERAIFFLNRFKHDEKMLGPNEQAALEYAIAALEKMASTADAPKGEASDEDIEAAVQELGMRWDGDRWICEDADLHPVIRALLARYAAPIDAAAMRNAALEQVAEAIEAANDKAGDAASYDNRDMHPDEIGRMHALTEAAAIARSLKTDQQEKP